MTSFYLNVLVSGLLIGIVYALIALGLTIIFGVMRVVNFAHGEMVVIGMYAGYWMWTYDASAALAARDSGGRVAVRHRLLAAEADHQRVSSTGRSTPSSSCSSRSR